MDIQLFQNVVILLIVGTPFELARVSQMALIGEHVVRLLENVMLVALASRQNIHFEPELLFRGSVNQVSSLHVFINLRDWHQEVQVEMVHNIVDHSKEDDECCVFEVCQLDVHRSELDSPANGTVH